MIVAAMGAGQVEVGDVVLRLVVAAALGGVIGLEREFHGRPAGLRTHIMVCLGATVVMLATSALSRLAPELALRLDPGRIAAGVVTGIGFIGAGAILRLKNTNRGLTTAACIWFVAALGVAVAVGAYLVAVAGTTLALVVLLILARAEKWIEPDWYRELTVVGERDPGLITRVRNLVEEMGLRVQTYDYEDDAEKDTLEVSLNLKFRRREVGEELLGRLRELPGVKAIRWRFPGA